MNPSGPIVVIEDVKDDQENFLWFLGKLIIKMQLFSLEMGKTRLSLVRLMQQPFTKLFPKLNSTNS